MAIQGFNYQEFAQNLTTQAQELVPKDFSPQEQQYVVNTLLNFSTLAGEAIYNDTETNFNADQAMMITQIIAEWSFHKSVDLIRSKIPQEYWDSIMQKIAYTIFEISKQTFKQGLPQEQILQLIEHHVKTVWVDSITELKDKNLIDETLLEQASKQSNIDAMMQQMSEEEQNQQASMAQDELQNTNEQFSSDTQETGTSVQGGSSHKVLKLATVALLFQIMKQDKVQTFLNKFDPQDAESIIKYMGIQDLKDRVSTNTTIKCLNEIRMNLPKPQELSPSKIIFRLKEATAGMDRQQLETLLQNERLNVKRLLFNALEGEYYEMAPRVANIIASHIQDSV